MQSQASSAAGAAAVADGSNHQSFSATLDKRGVRHLHRVLQCLQRIGSDVSVESSGDELLLRALAPSHAAYCYARLRRSFFLGHSFVNTDAQGGVMPLTQSSSESQRDAPQQQTEKFIKCKLHLKQIMLAFRNAQQTDRMDLTIVAKDNRMWITITIGGIKSKYGIPFEHQSNILQADFKQADSPNLIQFKPATLLKGLDNFSAKTTEVTLQASAMPPDSDEAQHTIRLKSYGAQATVPTAGLSLLSESINTESEIPVAQLEAFTVSSLPDDAYHDLTFNVKEVKAFLQLCDTLGETDVAVKWMNTVGGAMLLYTQPRHASMQQDQEPMLVALIVATLGETNTGSTPQPQTPAAASPAVHASQQAQLQQAHGGSQSQPQMSFQQKQSAVQAAGFHNADEMDEVPPTP